MLSFWMRPALAKGVIRKDPDALKNWLPESNLYIAHSGNSSTAPFMLYDRVARWSTPPIH